MNPTRWYVVREDAATGRIIWSVMYYHYAGVEDYARTCIQVDRRAILPGERIVIRKNQELYFVLCDTGTTPLHHDWTKSGF